MAKTYLEQAAASNLPEFLKALSDIIVQQQYSDVARMAAGLQLKNHLTSKDANTKREYTERWLQFPPDIREYIKNNVRINLCIESAALRYLLFFHANHCLL